MFVKAIEIVSKFTRPIHAILRSYDSLEIEPACSTFILINDQGYAITCKHVIENLIACEEVNNRYQAFKAERDELPKNNKRRKMIMNLEKKYGYQKGITIVNVKSSFMDSLDNLTGLQWWCHPTEDLALVKFDGFSKIYCDSFPVFAKDGKAIKQGKSLCRLGYPYPEFGNFQYNIELDDIEWTMNGKSNSPTFPIDGIVTRLVINDNKVAGIELSTPGLKWQSGGPLFDKDGIIYGMQSSTFTLPLGFDVVDGEIKVNGKKKKVNDYSFIHLGRCVHVDIIKRFLDEHGVKYKVEE